MGKGEGIEAMTETDSKAPSAQAEPSEAQIEHAAIPIYEAFPYDGPGTRPAWVPNGNSLKQGEARSIALSALKAAGIGAASNPVPAEDRELLAQYCDDRAKEWSDDPNAKWFERMALAIRVPSAAVPGQVGDVPEGVKPCSRCGKIVLGACTNPAYLKDCPRAGKAFATPEARAGEVSE